MHVPLPVVQQSPKGVLDQKGQIVLENLEFPIDNQECSLRSFEQSGRLNAQKSVIVCPNSRHFLVRSILLSLACFRNRDNCDCYERLS